MIRNVRFQILAEELGDVLCPSLHLVRKTKTPPETFAIGHRIYRSFQFGCRLLPDRTATAAAWAKLVPYRFAATTRPNALLGWDETQIRLLMLDRDDLFQSPDHLSKPVHDLLRVLDETALGVDLREPGLRERRSQDFHDVVFDPRIGIGAGHARQQRQNLGDLDGGLRCGNATQQPEIKQKIPCAVFFAIREHLMDFRVQDAASTSAPAHHSDRRRAPMGREQQHVHHVDARQLQDAVPADLEGRRYLQECRCPAALAARIAVGVGQGPRPGGRIRFDLLGHLVCFLLGVWKSIGPETTLKAGIFTKSTDLPTLTRREGSHQCRIRRSKSSASYEGFRHTNREGSGPTDLTGRNEDRRYSEQKSDCSGLSRVGDLQKSGLATISVVCGLVVLVLLLAHGSFFLAMFAGSVSCAGKSHFYFRFRPVEWSLPQLR
jgi:hypothetical protein